MAESSSTVLIELRQLPKGLDNRKQITSLRKHTTFFILRHVSVVQLPSSVQNKVQNQIAINIKQSLALLMKKVT